MSKETFPAESDGEKFAEPGSISSLQAKSFPFFSFFFFFFLPYLCPRHGFLISVQSQHEAQARTKLL